MPTGEPVINKQPNLILNNNNVISVKNSKTIVGSTIEVDNSEEKVFSGSGTSGISGPVGIPGPIGSLNQENDSKKNIATKEMVDKAKEELDKELKYHNEHLFLVKYDEKTAQNLLDFLKYKAKWKFRNAFGIIECVKIVEDGIKNFKTKKTKGLLFKTIALEAIAYYLSNHEDVGLEYAEIYGPIIEPLFDILQETSKLKTRIEILRKKYILYDNSFEEQLAIDDINIEEMKQEAKELGK